MNDIHLRALRGDDALGFLAALGTLRLCADDLGDRDARLGWPDGPWNAATLRTRLAASVDELAARLMEVVEETKSAGRLLPGVDAYPLQAGGVSGSSDPMNRRLSFEDGRGLAASAVEAQPALSRWLRGTICTSAVEPHKDDATIGALAPSPIFDVGPGTVHMARTLSFSLGAISDVSVLVAAVSSWRRVDYLGAYLDHRADRNAALGQDTKHKFSSYGEPGATWLALMATPFFELRGTDRGGVAVVGWSGRTRRQFTWPVWRPSIDRGAVTALLDHPDVRDVEHERARPDRLNDRLSALGISAVYAAGRKMAGNYAAALGAARQLWPRTTGATTGGRNGRRAGR